MAIEETMTQLSSLLKDATRPEVKIQAIRAREELRKDWLQLLVQAGILDAKPTTVFNNLTATLTDAEKRLANLTDEERWRFIKIASTSALSGWRRRKRWRQHKRRREKIASS